MTKIKQIPLMNTHKFTKSIFTSGDFDCITHKLFVREYFYYQGGNADHTIHGFNSKPMVEEGIEIVWGGNPFDLSFSDDNFIISRKR